MRFVGMRTICFLLVIGLAGCTGGNGASNSGGSEGPDPAAFADATTDDLVEELRSEFDDDNVAALIEAFSRAGVTVYDDELTEPLLEVDAEQSALQLTEFQARNMALELSAGGGYAGAQLDKLAQGKKSPSIAEGLVEYAGKGDTFGSELSGELLSDEPREARAGIFPTTVIALFLSDAAIEAGAEPPDVSDNEDDHVVLAAGTEIRAASSNICDQLSNFIGETGRAILGAVINRLPYVREVMFGLTLIVTAGSVLRTWTIRVVERPLTTHYGVGEPIEGTFTATIDTGGSFRWPAAVQSCARVVGLELPESQDAPGSEVTWRGIVGIPQHVTLTGRTPATVDQSSQSIMPFEVATEDAAIHEAGGPEKIGAAQVEVGVVRRDTVQLIRMIGEVAGSILNLPGAGSAIGSVAEHVARLSMPKGYGVVIVKHHELRTATISWSRGGASFTAYTCEAPRGPWTGTLDATVGATDFEFEFPANGNTKEVSGSFSTPVGAASFSGTATLLGSDAIRFVITTQVPGGGGTGEAQTRINYGRVAECRR